MVHRLAAASLRQSVSCSFSHALYLARCCTLVCSSRLLSLHCAPKCLKTSGCPSRSQPDPKAAGSTRCRIAGSHPSTWLGFGLGLGLGLGFRFGLGFGFGFGLG